MRDPEQIIHAAEELFFLPKGTLKGPSRKTEVKKVRYVVMDILRKENEMSLQSIGRCLGGRDHSTVISGLKRVDVITHPDILKMRERLIAHLEGGTQTVHQGVGYAVVVSKDRFYNFSEAI